VIIDDTISTGETSANAGQTAQRTGGPKNVHRSTARSLLGDSLRISEESDVDEIIGTDSVMNE